MNALDFFFRDYETRLTSSIFVTEGKAGKFLAEDPLLEYTPSQQFREAQLMTAKVSGKSIGTNFWRLLTQLRSESGVAVLPNLQMGGGGRNNAAVSGAVVVNGERMLVRLGSRDTESLLLLRNRYENGVINVGCPAGTKKEKKGKDIFEVVRADTSIRVQVSEAKTEFFVDVDLEGGVGELQCSDVTDPDWEREFADRTAREIERALLETIDLLQRHKADALGIGNMIYAKQPRLWKKLKKDWGERFAAATAHVHVDVAVDSTGMTIGKSTSRKGG